MNLDKLNVQRIKLYHHVEKDTYRYISGTVFTDYIYFLDFAGILPNSFHRLAYLQFIPALLSFLVSVYLYS